MNHHHSLRSGLAFLEGRQLPTGQFPVQATSHYKPGDPVIDDASPFATSHVISSLGFLPDAEVRPMLDRALAYLRREMTGPGLWRYWNRDAVWEGRPIHSFIPADLDDTASHSWLLRRHGVAFPDNRHLLLHNRDGEGRFYTWFVPRPRATGDLRYWRAVLGEVTLARLTVFWRTTEADYDDVDAVVNANVLLYLGDGPETAPVVRWLARIVETGREAESDKWYRDIFTFHYALSRCRPAGIHGFDHLRPLILDRLAAAVRGDGGIGENPMHTALALNTLFNMEIDAPFAERALAHLLDTQAADGGWPSAPYYYGGPTRSVSWGSRELTTGLCLEALARAGTTARPDVASRRAEPCAPLRPARPLPRPDERRHPRAGHVAPGANPCVPESTLVLKPGSPRKSLIMIMGVQRSGTTALFDILAEASGVSPRQESPGDEIYDDFYLRPETEIRGVLHSLPGTVLLKPVRESERRDPLEVAAEYRDYDLRIVWLYRDPVNVFHSYVRRGWCEDSTAAAYSFALDWCRRNFGGIAAAETLGDRMLVACYDDLTTHRPLVFDLAGRLGLRTTRQLREDSSGGRRALPAESQRILEEYTEVARRGLDARRAIRARGASATRAPIPSPIGRLLRPFVRRGKDARPAITTALCTAAYDEVFRTGAVGPLYDRWRLAGPIQREPVTGSIVVVGYEACRAIHAVSSPIAGRSPCPWRDVGESTGRAATLEEDFGRRRSSLRSRILGDVQAVCGAWPRNTTLFPGDRVSGLADRLVGTFLEVDDVDREPCAVAIRRLVPSRPDALPPADWEPIRKTVEERGLIRDLLRKGLLSPGETLQFVKETCLPLLALPIVVENTLAALDARPDGMRRVRADTALIRSAIDEALRLTPIFLCMRRRMTGSLARDGFRLARGDEVDLLVGAANRDPDAFPDPETFRVDRLGRAPFLLESENAAFTRLEDDRRPGCNHLLCDAAALTIEHLLRGCHTLRIQGNREPCFRCVDGNCIQMQTDFRLVCEA